MDELNYITGKVNMLDKKKRILALLFLAGLFTLASIDANPFSSQSQNTSEWRMFGRYLNHTKWEGTDFPVVPELDKATYTFSESVTNVYSASIVDGYAYVGASNTVYQLNASDVSQKIAEYTLAGGIFSTPAVANDYVYIGAWDKFYQLNASNISIKIAEYTTPTITFSISSSAVAGGYVYAAGSYDNTLYQLNASDVSQKIAEYSTGDDISSSPAVANGYVYVGSDDNKLYQLNASDISIKVAEYNTGGDVGSSPAVTDGYVYVGGNKLYQLNASDVSQLIAQYTTYTSTSSPAIADGYVYVGGTGDKVYQLNASNVSIKIAESSAAGTSILSSPAVAEGYVYIGSRDNKLHQFNASDVSQKIGEYTSDADIDSTPSIAKGYVYFGSYDGKIYQLNASNISMTTVAPTINITAPADNLVSNNTGLNVTYTSTDDYGISYCYYTDNGGASTNLTDCGNITNVTWTDGQHAIIVYAIDTHENTGSSSITFTVDTAYPTINITSPANNTDLTDADLDINYIASDANLNTCWYSNDTMSVNTTLAGCANITDITWSEGQHNVTIWVNDSIGNVNSSSVMFSIDSIIPAISITAPSNNTNTIDYGLDITYTVSDTNLDTCWYSNDSMSVNTTLAGCANITDLTWSEEQHDITIWANDSYGNLNSSSVTFTINPIIPTLNFTSPTPANNTIQSETNVEINVSITDSIMSEIIWNWNETNYTMYNDSLILMYNFDNISALGENSTFAVDISPGGHNGTTGEAADSDSGAISGGKHGGAFEFDGSGDEIDLGNVASLQITAPITLSSWFNADTYDTSSRNMISKEGTGFEGYALRIQGLSERGFMCASGSEYIMTYIEPNTDQWYHFALTDNGTTLKCFIDGILVGSTDSDPVLDNDLSAYIGDNFDGTIDEPRIYTRALSDDEIYLQYASNLKKFNTTQWYLYVNQSKNATTGLDDGNYIYQATSINTRGNSNNTGIRTITIDSTAPTINITAPSDNFITGDNGLNITYIISGSDLDSCWYSNDTMSVNTTLAGCANITDLTWSAGQHNVTIWVNDTPGNVGSSSISFTIDAVSPTFTSISNRTLEEDIAFEQDIDATDNGQVNCFTVNDTTNFKINCSGYLENNSALSVGLYNLNITVNDSVGLETSTLMWVNVTSSTSCWNASLDPHPVCSCNDLQKMNTQITWDYVQNNNIDCSDTVNWNLGAGFSPIGDSSNRFTGSFDGQWYNISNLLINRPTTDDVGLFGFVDSSTLGYVGFIDVNITGDDYIGALVGRSFDTSDVMNHSFSTGSIKATGLSGGLIGFTMGAVVNCYSLADVDGGANS
ncbi:PQQ-binding-like beta-propeller repeat protein, partial [Nanoarchaeota archaeon]